MVEAAAQRVNCGQCSVVLAGLFLALPLSPSETAASSTLGVPTSEPSLTDPRHAQSWSVRLNELLEPLKIASAWFFYDVELVAYIFDRASGSYSRVRLTRV
jgi:hypothetical protein